MVCKWLRLGFARERRNRRFAGMVGLTRRTDTWVTEKDVSPDFSLQTQATNEVAERQKQEEKSIKV